MALKNKNCVVHKNNALIYCSVFLIVLIYSNSLCGEWHFDDIPNIVLNQDIQAKNFTTQIIEKIFSLGFHNFSRPLSSFTFSLNYLLSDYHTFSYHLVNLCLHIFTFLLLVETITLFYKTPFVDTNPQKTNNYRAIAILTALLWAINPVQTQAVTYIVQRMALLAAFFYLAGIFFYLKFRLSNNKYWRIIFTTFVLVSYFFAYNSKENSVTLPCSIIIIELLFFQNDSSWRKYNRLIISILILTATAFILSFLFLEHNSINAVSGYQSRSFSLHERMLSETRIIIFYISQLLLPLPHRLSIAHDITLSQSLINPITGLYSIITIILLIGSAVCLLKKFPIYSFSIFFFFLNHLIESTIIPLELIFEHRNYLPSMFFFWPLTVFFFTTTKRIQSKKSVYLVINGTLFATIVFLSFSTYTRNETWKTEISLWTDAQQKAPESARPVFYLGVAAYNRGDVQEALKLYNNALNLTAPSPQLFKSLTHKNIADLNLEIKQINLAIEHYKKSLQLDPSNTYCLFMLAYCHYLQNDYEKSKSLLEELILMGKAADKTHGLLGKIYLLTGKPKKAIKHLNLSLQGKSGDTAVSIDLAQSFLLTKKHKQTLAILSNLESNGIQNSTTLLLKIVSLHILDKKNAATIETNFLIDRFSLSDIMASIQATTENIRKTNNNEDLLKTIKNIKRQITSQTLSTPPQKHEISQ